ncbi:hypothetical protein [Verrucomicrobium sp. BvORR034]|uniref:hypothetical protein n=1 Tax=Verrucomicrobium sp. BvORR034 TaxID=1396418 RepID=UPI000678460A|nr:hypothetical protein [Verrucomicrobium sp. BvORR034]
MKFRPSHILLALLAVVLLTLGLLYARTELTLAKFAALDQTYEGDRFEPGFSKPRWMPSIGDEGIAYLTRRLTANDELAYYLHNRLRGTLGARLPPIYLTNVRSIKPGFYDTLRQFSNATAVVVNFSTSSNGATEADATQVCEALRDLPRLRKIDLAGVQFTDSSIAPLAGHPTVNTLCLPASHITRASIPTLASMPLLGNLLIQTGTGNITPTEETLAIRAALSGRVTVLQR